MASSTGTSPAKRRCSSWPCSTPSTPTPSSTCPRRSRRRHPGRRSGPSPGGRQATRRSPCSGRRWRPTSAPTSTGEFTGVVDELYSVIEDHHVLLALIESSAIDIPELDAVYFGQARGGQVDQLQRYLEMRIGSGLLRAVPDTALATRFIIETVAWFAWHRRDDRDGGLIGDDEARTSVLYLLGAAFVPDGEFRPPERRRRRTPTGRRGTRRADRSDRAMTGPDDGGDRAMTGSDDGDRDSTGTTVATIDATVGTIASPAPDTGLAPVDRRIFAVAGVVFAVLMVLSGRYGFHRDELYFLDCARHLSAGYVDQPIGTPLLARFSLWVFGMSLPGLRMWPALAAAGTVVLAGLLAREFTRPAIGPAPRRRRRRHHAGVDRSRPPLRPDGIRSVLLDRAHARRGPVGSDGRPPPLDSGRDRPRHRTGQQTQHRLSGPGPVHRVGGQRRPGPTREPLVRGRGRHRRGVHRPRPLVAGRPPLGHHRHDQQPEPRERRRSGTSPPGSWASCS